MGWHRIAVGIGNPGSEYESTRHNVGFMVLDLLAERLGLSFTRLDRSGPDGSKRFSGKVKAQACEGRRKGKSFLLAKPQTYVNLTGEVAAPLLRYAKRTPDSLFVIVDDLKDKLFPDTCRDIFSISAWIFKILRLCLLIGQHNFNINAGCCLR